MCNNLNTHRVVRGFSLLELMIVLVVMVGLLAIAWPNMQRTLRRTTLNEAAQVLREAIDEGRYEAITTGKPIFVQMQQGNHEVRTGSFSNFANAEDVDSSFNASSLGMDSNQSPVLSDATATAPHAIGLKMHADGKTPRTWRLPDSIVITEVNWTSDSVTGANDESAFGSDTNPVSSDANSSTKESSSMKESGDAALANGLTDSEAATAAIGTPHSDWWLPISATGQSRNVSIVLYDTSIHEKMTVTYASSTGALEIVR